MNRYISTKRAGMFGMICNIFLMIIKGIVSFITGSQAMIADAFNSAGDIFSSLMTFIGNKISSKPCDEDHNLGHGKAEYIYSMLISISMILMSLFLLKDSISSLINNKTYEFSIWLIVVCLITIITKLILYFYTNKLHKKYNNLLLKANSKDHFYDSIITTLNLISCIFSIYGIYFLDGVVGTFISIWILIVYIKIFIESYNFIILKFYFICVNINVCIYFYKIYTFVYECWRNIKWLLK